MSDKHVFYLNYISIGYVIYVIGYDMPIIQSLSQSASHAASLHVSHSSLLFLQQLHNMLLMNLLFQLLIVLKTGHCNRSSPCLSRCVVPSYRLLAETIERKVFDQALKGRRAC